MKNKINILLSILENPFAKKSYKEYKNYLELLGQKEEAEALEYLIQQKFKNVNNSNIDKK